MKFIKKILITITVLTVVILAGVVVYLKTLDLNSYKPEIQKIVFKHLARNLVINGDIELVIFSLNPSVSIKNIELQNPDWAENKNMIQAEELNASINLKKLMHKKIDIESLYLKNAKINIEKNEQNQSNLDFSKNKSNEQGDKSKEEKLKENKAPFEIELGQILIENAQVINLDKVKKSYTIINIEMLNLKRQQNQIQINAEINMQDSNFKIAGNSGRIVDLINDAQSYPVNLDVSINNDAANLSLKGFIEKPLSLQNLIFNIAANVVSFPDFMASFGKEGQFPEVSLNLTADVTGNASQTIDVKNAKITANNNLIDFNAKYQNTKIPFIYLNAKSQLLDFSNIKYKNVAADNKIKNTNDNDVKEVKAIETQSIQDKITNNKVAFIDFIRNYNLDFLFKINDLAFANHNFKDVSISSKINSAVSKNTLDLKNIAQGQVLANVDIDAKTYPASIAAEIDAKDIMPQELLKNIKYISIEDGGKTNADFDFTTKGETYQELADNLNGRIVTLTGKTKIKSPMLGTLGEDMTSQILNVFKSGGREDVDMICLVSNVLLSNGIAYIDKSIAMETNNFNAVANGDVNLRQEKLNVSIKPYATEGIGLAAGQIITGVTKIGGTLTSPSVSIDTKGLAKNALSIGTAVATGGVSLLGEKILSENDLNPCYTALKGSKYFGMYKREIKTQPQTPQEQIKDEFKQIKDKIKSIKDIF